MEETELIPLSASRVKTFETCSQIYYAQYVQKIRSASNLGAQLGTITHAILECLIKDRHAQSVKQIRVTESLNPSVTRLLNRHLDNIDVNTPENFEKVTGFILVALETDFYFEGCEKIAEPEFKFDIVDKQKRFRIKGFIDIFAFYKDHAKIVDYKTSKSKFSSEDLAKNLQAKIYQWVVKQVFNLPSTIEFLFLKFKRNPVLAIGTFSDLEFEELENYLTEVSAKMASFRQSDATSSLASCSRDKWLCGSTVEGKWCCQYRKPFDYYAVVNGDGEVFNTSINESELTKRLKDGQVVIKKRYKGCPAWNS